MSISRAAVNLLGEKALLQEVDLKLFTTKSLTFIQTYQPYTDMHQNKWQAFCSYVLSLPNHPKKLNDCEKLLLLQVAFRCLKTLTNLEELSQFIRSGEDLKYELGVSVIQQLFEAEVPDNKLSLEHYISCAKLLAELKYTPAIFKILDSTLPDLALLREKLMLEHAQMMQKKYPERNINETILRFTQCNDDLQFPLASAELALIKQEYLSIKNYQSRNELMSLVELKANATLRATELRQQPSDKVKFELLAIEIELIRRFYKIRPYDTQVLALLALLKFPAQLKGRIAQIKTGEGKSTIIAMLSAFKACTGDFVDIVTSSAYLGKRDAEKYAPFYQALNLTVSAIHDQSDAEDFKGQVIYGPNTAYEFAWLREGTNQVKIRSSMKNGQLQPRTFDTAIDDEVDNIFLDKALNSAIISIPNKNIDNDYTWIYPVIFDFIKKNTTAKTSSIDSKALLNYLFATIDPSHHPKIKLLSDFRINQWFNSAMDALYVKKLKEHYEVKDAKIEIIDAADTGRRNKGSQWQHGVHQFLQAKHGLKITSESLSIASISHPSYFSLYKNIFGLTGTMGEKIEREEVQQIYQVDSFDVPPHFPSKRIKLPSQMIKTKEEHERLLIEMIQAKQKAGCPVLVLFPNVKETEIFTKLLQAKAIKHQVLNDYQAESEDYLVARAGEAGMVTVATNTAGRGTDILLSRESITAGGLCVLLSFYPHNSRVQTQNIGRCGRQGLPGCYAAILNLEDENIKMLLEIANQAAIIVDVKKEPADEIVKVLDFARSLHISQESKQRLLGSQKEALNFEKLQIFFAEMQKITQLFNNPNFKQQFLQDCEHFVYQLDQVATIENDLDLKSLKDTAFLLFHRQAQGLEADWSGFFESFKSFYLTHSREQWAKFYNKLYKDIECHDIQEFKYKVEECYQDSLPSLKQFLFDPVKNSAELLQHILNTASFELVNELEVTKSLILRS